MRRAELLRLLLPLLVSGYCSEGQPSVGHFEGGDPRPQHRYSREAVEPLQAGALLLTASAVSFATMKALDIPFFDPNSALNLTSGALLGITIAGITLLTSGTCVALYERQEKTCNTIRRRE